jgi:alpha-1,3-glucosyltransferase
VLLQPASIIVDHGHFQYNCISLGLALLAAVAIAKRKDVLGSVLFCLSLNHKQMGLFYAPAFFAHLLGGCLQQPTHTGKVGCAYSTAIAAACA